MTGVFLVHVTKQTGTNVLQGYNLQLKVMELAEFKRRLGSGDCKDLRLLTLVSTSPAGLF